MPRNSACKVSPPRAGDSYCVPPAPRGLWGGLLPPGAAGWSHPMAQTARGRDPALEGDPGGSWGAGGPSGGSGPCRREPPAHRHPQKPPGWAGAGWLPWEPVPMEIALPQWRTHGCGAVPAIGSSARGQRGARGSARPRSGGVLGPAVAWRHPPHRLLINFSGLSRRDTPSLLNTIISRA